MGRPRAAVLGRRVVGRPRVALQALLLVRVGQGRLLRRGPRVPRALARRRRLLEAEDLVQGGGSCRTCSISRSRPTSSPSCSTATPPTRWKLLARDRGGEPAVLCTSAARLRVDATGAAGRSPTAPPSSTTRTRRRGPSRCATTPASTAARTRARARASAGTPNRRASRRLPGQSFRTGASRARSDRRTTSPRGTSRPTRTDAAAASATSTSSTRRCTRACSSARRRCSTGATPTAPASSATARTRA